MKTRRPRGDNGPSVFAEEDKLRKEFSYMGKKFFVAVGRNGMVNGPLFVSPDICAERTCPGQGFVYEVKVIRKVVYPPESCMKL